eukprot:6117208-Amphidinium_carterae.1
MGPVAGVVLQGLFSACICQAVTPAEWIKAEVIPVPKPNKKITMGGWALGKSITLVRNLMQTDISI